MPVQRARLAGLQAASQMPERSRPLRAARSVGAVLDAPGDCLFHVSENAATDWPRRSIERLQEFADERMQAALPYLLIHSPGVNRSAPIEELISYHRAQLLQQRRLA